MAKQQFGMIGVYTMGSSLALNIESRGYSLAVHDRAAENTKRLMEGPGRGKRFTAGWSLEEFVDLLERPRRIMLMIKAGSPVDEVIGQLIPLLSKGDLVIDGGNSFFGDTIRRNKTLGEHGLMFIGAGVSGGEEGALKGPSIMPGGQLEAYQLIEPIFTKIAAHVDAVTGQPIEDKSGVPCCAYIGPDGAGHYVKMVHNGIEYGDMQLIAEACYILQHALGLDAPALAVVFEQWNSGELNSFLIEITAKIFKRIDAETGRPLIELILDKAGQKGTGKWTSESALDLGVCAPTIAEAVFARCMSAIKDERVAASKVLAGPASRYGGDREAFIAAIRDALYASKICSYAQGFQLLRAAGQEYKWDLHFGEIAMIWRGGCIIRAHFLNRIKEAFEHSPKLANLLLDPYFKDILERSQANWRKVVSTAAELGIPVPAFSSALSYYDSYRRDHLPANIIQAQRDLFGAHTYERIDKPGSFHSEWT